MVKGCPSDYREGASGTRGWGLAGPHRERPLLVTSLRPLNSNQPWRAKGSSLICTNFSDKFNLKIQLKCNQQSEPTRKSPASLGATRTMSKAKEAREFAGLHQGTELLLRCHQHELWTSPPGRAPSQFPPLAFGKATVCRGKHSGLESGGLGSSPVSATNCWAALPKSFLLDLQFSHP